MINAIADKAPSAVSTLIGVLNGLFNGLPESYWIFIYFTMTFIICVSFKFLIDFLKIVFSLIFTKGGF